MSLPPTTPKMFSTSPDQTSLIRRDDKFFSRLLSKESSLASCPSFRVYYAVAPASVPFLWESQPGTPKHSITPTTLPPLTPPPSFNFRRKNCTQKASRSSLFQAIFSRLTLRKTRQPSSPTISSSSSSSSSSLSLTSSFSRHSWISSSRSLFSFRGSEDEDIAMRAVRRRHSMAVVKNALLSIVGHGSSRGTAA